MAKKRVKSEEVSAVKAKPVMPHIYEDGNIQMPSVMITTKERFMSIWKGKCKGQDLEKAWKKAESFRNRYD